MVAASARRKFTWAWPTCGIDAALFLEACSVDTEHTSIEGSVPISRTFEYDASYGYSSSIPRTTRRLNDTSTRRTSRGLLSSSLASDVKDVIQPQHPKRSYSTRLNDHHSPGHRTAAPASRHSPVESRLRRRRPQPGLQVAEQRQARAVFLFLRHIVRGATHGPGVVICYKFGDTEPTCRLSIFRVLAQRGEVVAPMGLEDGWNKDSLCLVR